jgi:hypothetical protein
MKRTFILIFSFLIILSSIIWYIWSENKEQEKKESFREDIFYYEGSIKPCATDPLFPLEYGLEAPYLIDLRQKGYRGLRILEYKEDGLALHLPGWDSFGWLGLYSTDRMGNIYLTPVPHESTKHNPVGEQNRILKVDHQSGELQVFMELPQKKESTLRNPFGSMGIFYDCDNDFLYVSSVAGSGMKEELGCIYQIDIQKKEIISKLEGIDAIAISIYNTNSGKRLYYGSARTPEIFSVALDQNGALSGQPKKELSLLEQPGGADDRAHKISFQDKRMEVRANAFNFTLAAASNPMVNIYTFDLSGDSGERLFQNVRSLKQ